MKKILIVDDEMMILKMLERILVKENYEVIQALSGEEALLLLEKIEVDGVLLDLSMTGMDGLEVLKKIRENRKWMHLPVILVSAKDEEIDTIIGLELGADDYITKPFKPRELVARMKAIFKRIERDKSYLGQCIEFGDVKVYVEHRKVYKQKKEVELGQKEFNLLVTLIRKPGRVFTRDELLDMVWHETAGIEERTVDVHIGRLRKKIENSSDTINYIETIRGVGYRFNHF